MKTFRLTGSPVLPHLRRVRHAARQSRQLTRHQPHGLARDDKVDRPFDDERHLILWMRVRLPTRARLVAIERGRQLRRMHGRPPDARPHLGKLLSVPIDRLRRLHEASIATLNDHLRDTRVHLGSDAARRGQTPTGRAHLVRVPARSPAIRRSAHRLVTRKCRQGVRSVPSGCALCRRRAAHLGSDPAWPRQTPDVRRLGVAGLSGSVLQVGFAGGC